MTARLTDRVAAGIQSRTAGVAASIQSRTARAMKDPEAGMSTAEYALGTVAAAGCAGLLLKIMTSNQVLEIIKKIILKAFHL